jgi:hypothetical protein
MDECLARSSDGVTPAVAASSGQRAPLRVCRGGGRLNHQLPPLAGGGVGRRICDMAVVPQVNCRDLPPGNRQAPLLQGVGPWRQRRGLCFRTRMKMQRARQRAGPALARSSSRRSFARRNRVCDAMAHSARSGGTGNWKADTVTGSVPGTLLMESAGCGQRRSWMLVTLLYGRTSYTRGRRAVGSGEPSASGGQRFSSATPCQPHWGVHRARQAATKGLSKMEGDGISRIDSASVSRQCGCGCGWS